MKRTWIHTITVFALVVLWMPALVMFPEPQAHAAERHAKPPIPNILGKYIGIFHSDVNGTGGLMEFNIPALKKIGQFTGTLNFNGENSLRLKGRFLTKRLFSAIASKRGMVVRMKGQSSLDGETITGTYISRAGRNRDKGAFSISRYHANVVGGYIGPDGGKITTEDGASLIVPPGVFDEYSLVTVQSVSEDDLPQSPPVDSALLGGIEIESNITNLNGSAIITVPLKTPLIPGTPVPIFIFDPL